MSKKTIQIADKPTLDEVLTKITAIEQSAKTKIVECTINDVTPYDILVKEVSTLPYAFYRGCAVVVNGEIHILGGGEVATQRYHYKWDGTSWVSVSTVPCSVSLRNAVVLDGEIHLLGGFGTGLYNKHCKWDGTSWTSVSTLPFEISQGEAVVLDGEIHLLGGSVGTSTTKKNTHYKWDGTSWTSVSTLPHAFTDGCAVVLDGEIHLLGGYSTSNDMTTCQCHYKWDGTSWTSVSTLPHAFTDGCAVVLDGEIHILHSHYKFNGTSWVQCSLTSGHNAHDGCAVVLDDEIHVLGGGAGTSSATATQHHIAGLMISKTIKLHLFKGQRVYTDVSDIYPMSNCSKATDHIEVTEDGIVEFALLFTDATKTILTII